MSRAMGSSCVFTCWGAASWHGGRVMLVFGARAAAGAGSCAGDRGSAPFGVVVVLWLLAGGCPGRWCCPCVRFRSWPVVGVELV